MYYFKTPLYLNSEVMNVNSFISGDRQIDS